MVRRAEFAVSNPRRLSDKFYVRVGIGDVGLDLLKRAGRQETGRGAHERNLAAVGEARPDADHVLFSDADIERAVRPALAEAAELRRADAVVNHDHDAIIAFGDLIERRGERVAAIEKLRGQGLRGAHVWLSS